MIEIISGNLFVGSKAIPKTKPNKNGYITAFIVNDDKTIKKELVYLNINNIKKI